MTTGIEFPDREVTETLGVIYGVVVRSMGGVVASVKALRAARVSQYTQLWWRTRGATRGVRGAL